METAYYNNLFKIEDPHRKNKYCDLLLSSLKNDMSKWTSKINSESTIYTSPKYNGSDFHIEIRNSGIIFAFVNHSKPVISFINSSNKKIDVEYELITNSFSKELANLVDKMRVTVFSDDIKELEKLVGSAFSRKDKLDALEISHLTEIVEDSYKDWENDQSESMSRMIARVMYSYRNHEELYKLWEEKFGDVQLITKELVNLGYTPKK